MDETKYVAVPQYATGEQLCAMCRPKDPPAKCTPQEVIDHMAAIYREALAAAPQSHVAVKRELLERAMHMIDPAQPAHTTSDAFDISNELRALLKAD